MLLYFDKKKRETGDETETKLPLLQAQFQPVDDSILQALRDRLNNNETNDTEEDESTNKLPIIQAQVKPISFVKPSIQPSVTKGNNIDDIVLTSKGHNFFIGM